MTFDTPFASIEKKKIGHQIHYLIPQILLKKHYRTGVWFSVRFPVFVLLTDKTKKNLMHKIHKIFRFVRGPVLCPVSGFCTSDCHSQKHSMQVNLY